MSTRICLLALLIAYTIGSARANNDTTTTELQPDFDNATASEQSKSTNIFILIDGYADDYKWTANKPIIRGFLEFLGKKIENRADTLVEIYLSGRSDEKNDGIQFICEIVDTESASACFDQVALWIDGHVPSSLTNEVSFWQILNATCQCIEQIYPSLLASDKYKRFVIYSTNMDRYGFLSQSLFSYFKYHRVSNLTIDLISAINDYAYCYEPIVDKGLYKCGAKLHYDLHLNDDDDFPPRIYRIRNSDSLVEFTHKILNGYHAPKRHHHTTGALSHIEEIDRGLVDIAPKISVSVILLSMHLLVLEAVVGLGYVFKDWLKNGFRVFLRHHERRFQAEIADLA